MLSPRPQPLVHLSSSRPKAAGLVPVMAASYWLMALMAGCDWLTLRLKFIHSGVAGELLPAPGPCLVKTCVGSLSLSQAQANSPGQWCCTNQGLHFISLTQ